jgi:uncharacterized protein YceK
MSELSTDRAGLHKELGFLLIALLLSGCASLEPPTAQEVIEKYDAYWGSVDEQGNTGWCSSSPIPPAEYELMKDCDNATPERTVKGMSCPKTTTD